MKNRFNKYTCHGKMLLLSLLMLCISGITNAQVFSLSQVLDSIQTNNPGLQQFVLKASANRAEGNAVKGWPAPIIGAGLNEFPLGSGDMQYGMMPRKMLMVRLQQMFPNFGKQRKEKAYYESLSKLDTDDRATMKNRLLTKAKFAYYNAYVAEKRLAVIRRQEKQVQLLIDIFQGRLPYDRAKLPAIYKARARLSDLQSMEIQLQSATHQSAAVLNSLMNRSQEAAFIVDTTENFEQVSLTRPSIDSYYIMSNRSDMKHFSDEMHSLRLNKEAILQETRPVFGLTWDNMRMNGNRYMYSAMATLSVPIAPWFSKGYQAKANAIDYQIQALQKRKAGQLLQAIGNIHSDQLKLEAAERDLTIFKNEVIPAYEKTYKSYMIAFSENAGNLYETLDAWNDLTQKQLEYWDKVSKLLNIRVMLETELQQP